MSTLLDFLHVPVRMEDVANNKEFEINIEPPWGNRVPELHDPVHGIDEFHEYVTFNMFNDLYPGSAIVNATDEYEHRLTSLFNGRYFTDLDVFDFGNSDFTIELQYGVGEYYDYNELEGRQWIPLFGLGTDTSIEDSNVLFYMSNPGNPNYVQKGDLHFVVKDTAGAIVNLSIGSGDWYLPTTPAKNHAEFCRNGQTFTFKLLSLYGQKSVSFTSPSFGAVDISQFTRFYFGTLPSYGSMQFHMYSFKVTKGFCRNKFPVCAGVYGNWHRKSRMRSAPRLSANTYCLSNLINPIVGLPAVYAGTSYKGVSVPVPDVTGTGFATVVFGESDPITLHVSVYGEISDETVNIPDEYWSNVEIVFNADDVAVDAYLTTDKKGSTLNYKYFSYGTWSLVASGTTQRFQRITDNLVPFLRNAHATDAIGFTKSGQASLTLQSTFTLEIFFKTVYSDPISFYIGSTEVLSVDLSNTVIYALGGSYYYGYNSEFVAAFNVSGIRYLGLVKNGKSIKVYASPTVYITITTSVTTISGEMRYLFNGDNSYPYGARSSFLIRSFRLTNGVARTIPSVLNPVFPGGA